MKTVLVMYLFVLTSREKDFGCVLSTVYLNNDVIYAQKCTVSSESEND